MHVHDLTPWQHRHVFDRGNAAAMHNTWRVAALTAIMMVGEIVAGWLFNSMALLADGWHMSTHALAIGLTGLAYYLSRRLANDDRFAFGTWKIEILSSYTSALLLGVVALAMIVESCSRLLQPVNISFDQALWVAIGGLLVNLISAWLLAAPSASGHSQHHHGHHHDHGHGHVHDDLNLKAAYIHVVADAFTSVLAIVALLAGKYAGWSWLDPLMGVIGAGVILVWAYRLISESSSVLLDREMDHPVVDEIRLAIESDGDAKLTDVHVWRVGRNHYACIVSLVADEPLLPDAYRARLKEHHELAHISVEVNPCAGAATTSR
jgi:cation diffusion facilitator family transporter